VARLGIIGTVCASLLLCGGGQPLQSLQNGQVTMSNDPYFNRIAMELIRTPPSSRDALQAASSGKKTSPAADGADALVSARSWPGEIVKTPYLPPDTTSYLLFPMEAGICDVIRAAFKSGGYEFEIAQSRYLISLRISGVRALPQESDLERARRIAREVLVQGGTFQFAREGDFQAGSYGRHLSSSENVRDADWPHWFDQMRWWADKESVGFLTIKATGGPTRNVIDVSEGLNVHWFSK